MRGATLLTRIIKCNYNWKFPFLRPTIEEVVDERYTALSGQAAAKLGRQRRLLLRLQARTVGEAAAAAAPAEAAAADADGAGAEK